MSSPKAVEFRNKMKDMLDFLIPNYIAEGKTQLVIAIGCTGGKHRSVTLTNAMYEEYANTEYGCKKEHRDIEKDRLRSVSYTHLCRELHFPETVQSLAVPMEETVQRRDFYPNYRCITCLLYTSSAFNKVSSDCGAGILGNSSLIF